MTDENKNTEPVALTKEEFEKIIGPRVERISKEFANGFEFLRGFERTVTFFGSARLAPENDHYQTAKELARRIAEYGIGVVTGGGPGIMEAANHGAYEANGYSIGLNIVLPSEQKENPYLTESATFRYFFVRKVFLAYAAEAYIFFPGGFGTLDEFFEVVTLIQTGKMEKAPIICVGSDYWNAVDHFIKTEIYEKHRMIEKGDTEIYTITDNLDEVVDMVRHAPIRSQM